MPTKTGYFMLMIQRLQQSVQSVINAGRIGSPVFARCTAQMRPEQTEVLNGLSALIELVNTWMPVPLGAIYALESEDKRQITAMTRYAGGQTAILSVNRVPEAQETSIDLVLIGNRGVIYHETPSGRHQLMNESLAFSGGGDWLPSIRQSITTGQPVKVMEEKHGEK
jgi:hypothetical protein